MLPKSAIYADFDFLSFINLSLQFDPHLDVAKDKIICIDFTFAGLESEYSPYCKAQRNQRETLLN